MHADRPPLADADYREIKPQDAVTVSSGTIGISGTVTTTPATAEINGIVDGYDFVRDAGVGIVAGEVGTISYIRKFGCNEDIDTTTDPEDVWDAGGLYTFPTSAAALEVVSTSTNDVNTTGTGAWKVYMEGLDGSYAVTSETVNLNGTTAVATSNSYLRVYRAYITEMGIDTSEANLGDISIQGSGGGTVYAQINTGFGQTEMAIYTVPAGKTAYMTKVWASVFKSAATSATFKLITRDNSGTNPLRKVRLFVGTAKEQSLDHQMQLPLSLPEKTDIILNCEEVAANNTGVYGGFDLILK